MENERRSAQAGPRLRLHRPPAPGMSHTLRLPVAQARGHAEGASGDVPSVEAIEARAATALAGLAQRRRPVGSEEARPVLPPNDPRWVLAVRVAAVMRGEILRPADRTRLNRLGRSMGLTPFQCSLVIAIVQDQARRGQMLGDAAGTLAIVPRGEPGRQSAPGTWRRVAWITALVLTAEAALLGWSLM